MVAFIIKKIKGIKNSNHPQGEVFQSFTKKSKTMQHDLANALKALLSLLGPISQKDYRACFGENWDLSFQGKQVFRISPLFFSIIENRVLLKHPYTDMKIDELLDVYLVAKKMLDYRELQWTEIFHTGLGLNSFDGEWSSEDLGNEELQEELGEEGDSFF